MPDARGLKNFEKALERGLEAGWLRLRTEGAASEVIAYGVISPEGMENVEPYVLTRADAAVILRSWECEEQDPRAALAFPASTHQGGRLETTFLPVTEAYAALQIDEQEALENEARSIIEAVVVRVLRRLIKRGAFGERSADVTGPFLGFFGYEIGESQLADHLRELNPPEWVDEWVAAPADATPGELVPRGKPAADVAVDNLSLHGTSGLLVNTSWSGLVRFWQLDDLAAPTYSRTDLSRGVTTHALSADGSELYLAWRDTIKREAGVQGMNTKTRKRRDLGVKLDDDCWALATVPERPWLVIGTSTGEIIFWNLSEDRPVRDWRAHEDPVRSLVCTRDGRILYSGSRTGGLNAWNIADGTLRFSMPHLDAESILLTPKETHLITLACGQNDPGKSEVVTILDAQSGTVAQQIRLNPAARRQDHDHLLHGARCAAISDDGTRLALGVGFGEYNAHLRLLEFPGGKELHQINVGHQSIDGVVFAPGDSRRVLFTGRHFRGAQLYDWTAPA